MEKNQLFDLLEEIIVMEWEMFQKVENFGGRAACQNDFETFHIMRFSQYYNWSDEMLIFWIDYLKESARKGRNLVTEKYAWMMETTEKNYFNQFLRDKLPKPEKEADEIIREILDILIPWEEEFQRNFPNIAATGREIRSKSENESFATMETYARGELKTYPPELLKLYLKHLKKIKSSGKSISYLDRNIMCGLYGYESIEEAEKTLAHNGRAGECR